MAWRFDDDFPSGASRARARDASYQWSLLPQIYMYFDDVEGDYPTVNWIDTCDTYTTYQRNVVGYGSTDTTHIPDQNIASTKTCEVVVSGGINRMTNFRMLLSDEHQLYNGTDAPGGAQFDVWGIMTHEFGHATGRTGDEGHFAEAPEDLITDLVACGSDATENTMCADPQGSTLNWRSLGYHDGTSFNNVAGYD